MKLYKLRNEIVEEQKFTFINFTSYNGAISGTAKPHGQDQSSVSAVSIPPPDKLHRFGRRGEELHNTMVCAVAEASGQTLPEVPPPFSYILSNDSEIYRQQR